MSAEQEAVDQFNEEMGLNRPFLTRFVEYIKDIVTKFEFGKSYRTRRPVVDEIVSRFPTTFRLSLASIICVVVLGVPLGILSAIKRSTIVDASITVYAMFLAAVPGFWFGMILIYVVGLKLGWLPTYGVETWHGYILPLINATGLTFSGLLGGAVILETIYSIPGIGMYIITAIRQRDIPVVMACTIFLATIFCSMVLLIDLLYAYVDPRIRAKFFS